MLNAHDEDAAYELFARTDYIREAYGDLCPFCGALRWQADCPYVDEVVGHLSLNDIQALRHHQLALPLQFDVVNDDIVF